MIPSLFGARDFGKLSPVLPLKSRKADGCELLVGYHVQVASYHLKTQEAHLRMGKTAQTSRNSKFKVPPSIPPIPPQSQKKAQIGLHYVDFGPSFGIEVV